MHASHLSQSALRIYGLLAQKVADKFPLLLGEPNTYPF